MKEKQMVEPISIGYPTRNQLAPYLAIDLQGVKTLFIALTAMVVTPWLYWLIPAAPLHSLPTRSFVMVMIWFILTALTSTLYLLRLSPAISWRNLRRPGEERGWLRRYYTCNLRGYTLWCSLGADRVHYQVAPKGQQFIGHAKHVVAIPLSGSNKARLVYMRPYHDEQDVRFDLEVLVEDWDLARGTIRVRVNNLRTEESIIIPLKQFLMALSRTKLNAPWLYESWMTFPGWGTILGNTLEDHAKEKAQAEFATKAAESLNHLYHRTSRLLSDSRRFIRSKEGRQIREFLQENWKDAVEGQVVRFLPWEDGADNTRRAPVPPSPERRQPSKNSS